jgi:hypothetical protein
MTLAELRIAVQREAKASAHNVAPAFEIAQSSPTFVSYMLSLQHPPRTHCQVCLERVEECEQKYNRHRDWLRIGAR